MLGCHHAAAFNSGAANLLRQAKKGCVSEDTAPDNLDHQRHPLRTKAA